MSHNSTVVCVSSITSFNWLHLIKLSSAKFLHSHTDRTPCDSNSIYATSLFLEEGDSGTCMLLIIIHVWGCVKIFSKVLQCMLTFLSSSTLIARESMSSPHITLPTDGPVHISSWMCTAEPTGELNLSGVPPSLFLVLALLSTLIWWQFRTHQIARSIQVWTFGSVGPPLALFNLANNTEFHLNT